MGWVLTAFQNALYKLLHAPTPDEGVIATVHCGDTDTNAAICGALLGAVHGRDAVPQQWAQKIAECRPRVENARQPRPAEYWPHASAVPKVWVNSRSEDVIFFDGVFFEPSLKPIFFVS